MNQKAEILHKESYFFVLTWPDKTARNASPPLHRYGSKQGSKTDHE